MFLSVVMIKNPKEEKKRQFRLLKIAEFSCCRFFMYSNHEVLFRCTSGVVGLSLSGLNYI